MSQSNTRICLGYGGTDISQILHHLLETNMENPDVMKALDDDSLLLHKMKEERCHLDLDKCNLIKHQIETEDKATTIHLGDESLGLSE